MSESTPVTPDEHTHPSVAHRDACPVCNPDNTVPELNEAFRASNEQGPLWIPTLQVERMMRECKESKFDTVGVDRKTLEGLLHDSLLWRAERAALSQVTPPSAHETSTVQVAGDSLPTTLWQFEQRASVLLSDEQAKANPDNALIGFICDAVRLARENERLATSPLKASAQLIDYNVRATAGEACDELDRRAAENGRADHG